MKKLSITTNTGRCTELKFEWLGRHEKPATSTYPQNPIEVCHQDQRYQRCEPKGSKGAAAPSPPADLQRHLCEAQQGINEHAENYGAIHCIGVPKSEVCK